MEAEPYPRLVLFGVPDYWAFVLAALLIILLPGPNSMFVVSTSARRGRPSGFAAAAGVFVGDCALMVLTYLGAASVLRSHPVLFMAIKYLGAAYLGWIGLRLVLTGLARIRRPRVAVEEAAPTKGGRGSFGTALLLSLLNPKAILFYVAFFVQFLRPDAEHPLLTFFVLATTLQLLSMLYLCLLIVAGDALAARFRRHQRTAAGLSAGVGTVFLGFGIRLAGASLG